MFPSAISSMRKSEQYEISGDLESVEEDSAKKESRKSLYSPEWVLWVLQNYEYAEEGMVFVNEILHHSAEEKENVCKELTHRTLGCIIKDLFREKVRLVQRGPRGSRQGAYLNLQGIKHTQRETDASPSSSSVNSLMSTFELPNGWHSIKDGDDQVSFIRHESWEFSKQRGTTELRVKQKSPQEITLQAKSHGCSVDLKKDLGLDRMLSKLSMEKQILLAIQFIEHSHLCFGFQLKESESVMAMLPHATGVLQSMGDGLNECKRAFAQNCVELTGPSKICCNCSRFQTVNTKRKKRKANQTTVAPACSKRFMTREEVEYQLKKEQISRRNAEKRERRRKKRLN